MEDDLSKNRLCEVPEEVCQFVSLETLSLYHNCVRSLMPSLCQLQALTYLNIGRNHLSNLQPSVCQLPLLRVLIVSNNKLSALPATIHTLTHLRQLDVSCNELQSLPVELGQLECLRDLNLKRNQLTTLPEELSELPLVRLDVSCNRISHVPVCYRHLRHLQTIILDNNPLQMPPAQICSKGKFHIFKYLNMEACKRTQDQFEKALRPTAFNCCLLDQDLFPGQYGALDSGFNSVDSGSKRWSGNESADDFSERSLRLTEISREHKNFQEEEERETLLDSPKVNGVLEQVDFIDNSVTEEEEERCRPPLTESSQEKSESTSSTPSQSPESICSRIFVIGDGSDSGSPSSPTLEERRKPGNLLIWQERERAQRQKDRASTLQKITVKTGSNSATTAKLGGTGSVSGGDSSDSSSPPNGLKQRCASLDQVSSSSHPVSVQRSISRPDAPVKPCSPTGSAPKPNSFLFRASSRCNVKTGSGNSLAESGRSESRSMLKSPREERVDILQLQKSLESRLKITLPEDLGEALSNGTVLCQLANHVRPRSVSIIHIPSPAVPKLSAAKCRLNVENFIAACRRLGVPEMELCLASDILCSKLPAVQRCVKALLAKAGGEEEVKEDENSTSPSVSPAVTFSTGFLLFYSLLMALLYLLYCHLIA
ncbi:leucine-rich repeat and calponin homology domain-containing protein 4 isoform X3 [Myxocyprinus asiaticus]|uniref:leucine-rich repeat and calponin homology domain-containing protein 4 isoform X3 n=1 Tax=Myxocyprinus asiaticus TaxID=70543 RepID=UPI0022221737|nr:leucine-rich repeat and calponin homology domain-containing protein 4 isoform X3 [Myxocyprinus asiaticus]